MFKNLTERQLQKRNKICLIVAIAMLGLMAFFVGVSLYLSSHDTGYDWVIYLVPTVLLPLAMVPILLSSALSAEIKKKERRNN